MQEELIKSSYYYQQQMLSVMTDSEIAEIIVDKNKEVYMIKEELKQDIKPYRGESRQLLILLSEDREKEIETTIKFLQFQLKQRDPFQKTDNISIEELKQSIDIKTLIESFIGKQVNARRLINCPLRGHDDHTSSFKIYEQTNSFFCQGCKKGGDQIHFIEYFFGITRKEAIKKFRTLIK